MERTFHPLRSLPLNVKSEEGLLLFWKANALLGLQGSVQGSFFFLSFELLDPAPLFFSFRVHGSSPSWARACGSRHGPRRSKEPGAFLGSQLNCHALPTRSQIQAQLNFLGL